MFAVHTDENATQGIRGRNKQEPTQQKRTALVTITNKTRVQPFRNAKGGNNTDVENACRGKENHSKIHESKTGTFSIYIDEEAPIVTAKTEENLSSKPLTQVLTSVLPPIQHKDDALSNDISCRESPMVLDLSDDEKTCDTPKDSTRNVIIDVPEYAEEIYAYLREAELRNRPKLGYMRKQPDITSSMRSILIDWLVEVGEEYKLHRETLFLSVNYVDRFLSQMSVLRGKLQLVGAASMFLAAKYEEIYPPDVGEFVYITDNTYTQKQVLRMEHLILKVLAFDVAVPTTNWFCEKFLKQCGATEQQQSLAMYLCELTLVEADRFIKYIPSTIAASAVCLANHCFHRDAWPAYMEQQTGYSMADMGECLRDLSDLMKMASTHPQQAVQEKYSSSTYHEVSQIEAPCMLPS